MLKRIAFLTPLIITLTSCSPSARFVPEREELPDANIGTPYFQKVHIFGGAVITDSKPIPGTIEPEDNGIFMENCLLPKRVITSKTTFLFNGNCVEIKGTPIRTGTIKLTLDGMLYGNMFVSPGNFEKTYLIKVVSGKE